MPIVEVLGLALVTCSVPVLLLQRLEQRRLANAADGEGSGDD